MKFTVYNAATGQILRWGTVPDEFFGLQAHEGEGIAEGEFLPEACYWDGTAMVAFPARPDGHDWDWTSHAWVPNLDGVKAAKFAQIEVERDRRIAAPTLTYDGKLLDADAKAKSNLADKLVEANSRIARNDPFPVEELVWRGADNQMYYFSDTPSYKDWLDGFAIAMGSRGTQAYAWSWQKKADLDAITDLTAALAFDPTV